MLRALRSKVAEVNKAELESQEESEDRPVISLASSQVADVWTVEQDDGVFIVTGEKIEKFARRTNFDNYEGVNRLRDIMKKMGIAHELARKGAIGESVIKIGNSEFTFTEQ